MKSCKRQEFISQFRHAVDAKKAFAEMVNGQITRTEFEAKGYKLAKLS